MHRRKIQIISLLVALSIASLAGLYRSSVVSNSDSIQRAPWGPRPLPAHILKLSGQYKQLIRDGKFDEAHSLLDTYPDLKHNQYELIEYEARILLGLGKKQQFLDAVMRLEELRGDGCFGYDATLMKGVLAAHELRRWEDFDKLAKSALACGNLDDFSSLYDVPKSAPTKEARMAYAYVLIGMDDMPVNLDRQARLSFFEKARKLLPNDRVVIVKYCRALVRFDQRDQAFHLLQHQYHSETDDAVRHGLQKYASYENLGDLKSGTP